MGTVVATLVLFFSAISFAGGSLTCRESGGGTLIWNASQGKMIVTGANGAQVMNQNNLKLGSAITVDTTPPMTIIPILKNSGNNGEEVAQIWNLPHETQVLFSATIYLCN